LDVDTDGRQAKTRFLAKYFFDGAEEVFKAIAQERDEIAEEDVDMTPEQSTLVLPVSSSAVVPYVTPASTPALQLAKPSSSRRFSRGLDAAL